MATYRIGTFYHPDPFGKPPVKSRITAYSGWYSNRWSDCIEYDVEADSGAEARKKAVQLRLAHERAAIEPQGD